jgi:glutathione S-transferase
MPRILYHTPLSPSCRALRILLREKNVEFTLIAENTWERRVIVSRYAISEYVEETYSTPPFMGKTPEERLEVRRLVDWFDRKFHAEVTHNILVEKIFKRLDWGEGPDSQVMKAGRQNLLYHLDYIAFLTETRSFLAGDALSFADMIAAGHLSALDYLGDVPWDYNPRVKEWYALIKSRPSFRTILTDRFGGYRPPEYYENPDF